MIKMIAVGKIKREEMNRLIKEYLTRISKYTTIKLIEVNDASYNEVYKILEEEKDRIMKHIKPNDYLILFDINGVEVDSLELSKKIERILSTCRSDICFLIGGSYGVHEEVKERADFRLSFSRLTFPHQLFRLLAVEQVYRSFKIMKNESYHK